MNEPVHVNDYAFENAVLKSPLPVVVDFWAPWCAPCRLLAPSLDKIAEEFAGKLLVAKVNTDENAKWASQYRVSGIPTMLFFSGGQVVHQQVGAVSLNALRQLVERFLAAARTETSSVN